MPRTSFCRTKSMPSAPPAAPKYVMKVMLKFWLRFMGVEFHAEPAWLFVAVVRVTPLPPTKALPFVIHEAHTGGMVVGVKVGVGVGGFTRLMLIELMLQTPMSLAPMVSSTKSRTCCPALMLPAPATTSCQFCHPPVSGHVISPVIGVPSRSK